MKKNLFFLIFSLSVLLIFSCSDSNKKNGDDDEVATDEDSISPIAPDEDFFTPVSENSIIFNLKSIINSEEDYSTQTLTEGTGSFSITLQDKKIEIEETSYVYTFVYPEDEENEKLKGKEYLVIQTNEMTEFDGKNASYNYLTVGIPKEELKTVSDDHILPLSNINWATVYNVDVTLRTDGALFYRYCYVSYQDNENSDSSYFVDNQFNSDYSPGENLIIWGNIGLKEEIEITNENEETYCIYLNGSSYITKETYYEDKDKTEAVIDCEMPENYFDPIGESYASFTFNGKIHANNPASIEGGFGDFEVIANGEEFVVDDFRVTAGATTLSNSTEVVYIQGAGNLESVSATHTKYHDLQVIMAKSTLLDLIENKENLITDKNTYSVNAIKAEYKSVDGEGFTKNCAYAMFDLENENSSLFVCHNENNDFSPEEYLQLAGNVGLIDDENKILETYPECSCFGSDGSISCDEFDAM